MKSWFISDIHLTDTHERNGNTLLRFLFYLNRNPQEHRLFLLGDIFDAWASNGPAFTRHYKLIIDEIVKLKKSGGEVFYFEGNHDLHIDVFWTKKFNIPVIENRKYFDIDGLRLRLEHGDFINPQDKTYLEYRQFVHRPLVEFLVHIVPSHFLKWLSESHSKKSRKKTSRYAIDNADQIRTQIRRYAEVAFAEAPFDLIVTGHMHIFDEYEFSVGSQKRVRSINLGTWLEKPRTLKIENGKIEIIDLDSFNFESGVPQIDLHHELVQY
ncbi:MAG: UDP-2,3-diacylglucosamine diphosphatase [Bdellovibrionota bacterium]